MNLSSFRYLIFCALLLTILGSAAQAQIRFDRPKPEQALDNPYTIGLPREEIANTIRAVLKGCNIPLRDDGAKPANPAVNPVAGGKIVTQPTVFTRGVTTRNDLEYLAQMPASDLRNWTQGRYYLEISVLPLDLKRSQLMIVAHIEGRYADPMEGAKWIEGQSNGRLEDEVLRGLAGKILGVDLALKTATSQRRILNCTY